MRAVIAVVDHIALRVPVLGPGLAASSASVALLCSETAPLRRAGVVDAPDGPLIGNDVDFVSWIFLPRACAGARPPRPLFGFSFRDDLPWPGTRTPPQMPARTHAASWAHTRVPPAATPLEPPAFAEPFARGSVRSPRRPRDPGPAERSHRRGLGSSTSRRTIVPVISTRMTTTASADAPLWHTLFVTSSDTTSRASSRTNAGTRPRRRPTTIRAAPGARASSARHTSSAPPPRARHRRPGARAVRCADRNSAFSAFSAAAPRAGRRRRRRASRSRAPGAGRPNASRQAPSAHPVARSPTVADRCSTAPWCGCIGTASRNPPRCARQPRARGVFGECAEDHHPTASRTDTVARSEPSRIEERLPIDAGLYLPPTTHGVGCLTSDIRPDPPHAGADSGDHQVRWEPRSACRTTSNRITETPA